MTELYDVLDTCLQALEQGRDLNTVLGDYPDLAQELRPILEASLQARSLGEITIPANVQSRGRIKLLQRAEALRRLQRQREKRMIPFYSRLAVALGLAAVFFLSSTGLVSASSTALPGDQLYPVKRSWEDVRLFFAFNPQNKDILQSEFEQERLDEIDGLLSRNRAATVNFSGLVTQQNGNKWLVSGIPVTLSSSTQLSGNSLSNGVPVNITGVTLANGEVEAQQIQLLGAGVSLPPLEPSDKSQPENEDQNAQPAPANPATVSPPASKSVPTPGQTNNNEEKNPHTFEFHGVVNSMQDGRWTINGQSVLVVGAQIEGTILPGNVVTIQGYLTEDGTFVVTKIEEQSGGSSNSSNKDGSNNRDGGNNSGSGSGDSGGGGGPEPGGGQPGDH